MVTRKEQAARSKQLLVDVARRLFVEHGYVDTSVNQILTEADMAKGALYHHFPEGKMGLFNEVIDVVDHKLHERFDAVLKGVESPLGQIQAGFDVLLELAADREFARIILIEASVVMPSAWADGSEFELLKDALGRAISAGEIQEMPVEALASILYGAARRGADFVARSDDPASAAADTREILNALLGALRRTS